MSPTEGVGFLPLSSHLLQGALTTAVLSATQDAQQGLGEKECILEKNEIVLWGLGSGLGLAFSNKL